MYGFQFAGYVPVCRSPVSLASCMYGEEPITEEELLTAFTNYVTADDREVLAKCLSDDFDSQDDDLLEWLSSYTSLKLPTKENIKALLAELAHQERIQKPRYIAQCWSPIISTLKTHPNFWSVKSMKELFLDMKPTAKRVIT